MKQVIVIENLISFSFCRHVLRTNFYTPTKVAVSFRLSPDFLPESEYPKRPFGMFFVIGKRFTMRPVTCSGLTLKIIHYWADIRFGIPRIPYSFPRCCTRGHPFSQVPRSRVRRIMHHIENQVACWSVSYIRNYSINQRSLFDENYALAATQVSLTGTWLDYMIFYINHYRTSKIKIWVKEEAKVSVYLLFLLLFSLSFFRHNRWVITSPIDMNVRLTILQLPSLDANPVQCFEKYVDSILDLLIPGQTPGIKTPVADLYGKPELLFFGPDGKWFLGSFSINLMYLSFLYRGHRRSHGLGRM